MSELALRAEGLSKRFVIGRSDPHDTIRDLVADAARNALRLLRRQARRTRPPEDGGERSIWALRDLSFDVREGEILGIIGRNGAGKSTLLKILCGITEPTAGRAEVHGRVGSLLEVGTGFHSDLTGRDNVFLNGAILGMSREYVARCFDAIVDFAGVEEFIDTPIKYYSSGMRVRLAFAVAMHLEPEILVIDEVLAVGDAEFQEKCLGRMDGAARSGRTVLFVSHHMPSVRRLCSRCLWIDGGRLLMDGPAAETIHAYLSPVREMEVGAVVDLTTRPNRRGHGHATFVRAALLDEHGQPSLVVRRMQPITLAFEVDSRMQHTIRFDVTIVSESGANVLSLSHYDSQGFVPGVVVGRHAVTCTIPSLPLAAGRYSFRLIVQSEREHVQDDLDETLAFTVEDAVESPRPFQTVAANGFCVVPSRWTIRPLAPEAHSTGETPPQ
jgi:lipopolysaccharide transport system ATP-binding protein